MSRWSGRTRLMSIVVFGLVATPLLAAQPSGAQETVIIGGSGQSSVEINLEAIEQIHRLPEQLPNLLRHPGVDQGTTGHIKLRPPGVTRRALDDPPRVVAKRPRTPRVVAPTPPERAEQPLRPKTTPRVAATAERPAERSTRAEPAAEPKPAPTPVEAAPKPAEKMEAALEPAREPAPKRQPDPPPVREPTVKADPVVNIPIPEPEEEPSAAPVTAEKATAAPDAAETQVAALTPGDAPTEPGQMMRVAFPPGDANLPRTSEAALQTLATRLQGDESLRLQLKAYAGGDVESASQARRLSLSRALAVRSYFIDQGLRSTRIDVRALGNRTEDGPSERVDIILKRR